jgi:hypothetical protein
MTRVERPLARQREGDRPEPVPTSTAIPPARPRRASQHDVHEQLRLGTRDQHALVHRQGEVPKARQPGGVLQRRAAGPTHGRGDRPVPRLGRDLVIARQRRPVPRHVVHRGEELAGLALGLRAMGGGEQRGHLVHQMAHGAARRLRWRRTGGGHPLTHPAAPPCPRA